MGVTYAETREWAVFLRLFTLTDLARMMAVPPESIEGYLIGLQFNGTVEDTGERINGHGPSEPIYSFVPLPDGPRTHPHRLVPERMVGYSEILSPRGMPVRIRSERDSRKSMSTPGARGKIKRREARYQAMQEAVAKRKAAAAVREKERESRKTSGKRKAEAMAAARAEKRREKHKNKAFEF